MNKPLLCKGFILIKCNSCSVVQIYKNIPKFCSICNSSDIELYIDGRNRKEIKKLRFKYFLLEKVMKKGDGFYKISLDK